MAADVGAVVPAGAAFHHIGYACRDLAAEAVGLEAIGYAGAGDPFADPAQGVSGLFLEGGGPRLELLAPLAGSTVLDPWLSGGARMYHLAYEVADIDAAADALGDAGGAGPGAARLLGPPVPAVAFAQRRICFIMLGAARLLIELIENPELARRPR